VSHDPPGRLEPVQARHPDVHEHQVGTQAARQGHRLVAVGRLADDLDIRLAGQQHPQAGAHHRLVVVDEHPDRQGLGRSNGSRARSA
jgi:hypothetical protein